MKGITLAVLLVCVAARGAFAGAGAQCLGQTLGDFLDSNPLLGVVVDKSSCYRDGRYRYCSAECAEGLSEVGSLGQVAVRCIKRRNIGWRYYQQETMECEGEATPLEQLCDGQRFEDWLESFADFEVSGCVDSGSIADRDISCNIACPDGTAPVNGNFQNYAGASIRCKEVEGEKTWVTVPGLQCQELDALYAIGGSDGNTPLDIVEVSDGSSWFTTASLNTARYGAASAFYGGFLYAIGGAVALHNSLDSVEYFDGTSWSYGPSLNRARNEAAAVVYGDELFVLGGYDDFVNLRSTEIFDGNSWRDGELMTIHRREFPAVVYDGKIYAIGGFFGQPLSEVDVFSGSSWSSGPALPEKRARSGAAVLGGNLYVFGGYNEANGYLDSVLTLDGSSWTSVGTMQSTRGFFGYAVFDDKIHAIAGYDGSQRVDNTEQTFDGSSWSSGPSLSVARTAVSAVAGPPPNVA